MTHAEKNELYEQAKQFFTRQIAGPHLRKTKQWSKLSTYNVNPFLDRYLARFYTGTESTMALAQTLILPRALGTSITTSFGAFMQKLIVGVLQLATGSGHDGIDLEFVDALDGRKKYCQLKSGPKTINKDDIQTIDRHFTAIKNRAQQNHLKLMQGDLCVGSFTAHVLN